MRVLKLGAVDANKCVRITEEDFRCCFNGSRLFRSGWTEKKQRPDVALPFSSSSSSLMILRSSSCVHHLAFIILRSSSCVHDSIALMSNHVKRSRQSELGVNKLNAITRNHSSPIRSCETWSTKERHRQTSLPPEEVGAGVYKNPYEAEQKNFIGVSQKQMAEP